MTSLYLLICLLLCVCACFWCTCMSVMGHVSQPMLKNFRGQFYHSAVRSGLRRQAQLTTETCCKPLLFAFAKSCHEFFPCKSQMTTVSLERFNFMRQEGSRALLEATFGIFHFVFLLNLWYCVIFPADIKQLQQQQQTTAPTLYNNNKN